MASFILIEDRLHRQSNFLNNENNFDQYSFMKNVCGGNDFSEIKGSIENKNFNPVFDNYEIIAIHRSSIASDERNNLIEYCKKERKSLVFFSGGISSTIIQSLGQTLLLTINSKDFYSDNLYLFLNNNAENLMLLAYGEKWEINLYAKLNEKLAYCIHSNELSKTGDVIDFQTLASDLEMSDFEKNIFYKKGLTDDSLLNKTELQGILKEVNDKVKSLV